MLLQKPRVLGVEQEHDAHDEHVQAALLARVVVKVLVLSGKRAVEAADHLARLHGQLVLAHEAAVRLVGEEREQVGFLRQLG